MITEAATSRPNSVRRRALKARRRCLDSGSSKPVADIRGEPTGAGGRVGGAGPTGWGYHEAAMSSLP